jgi:hypothetical protein
MSANVVEQLFSKQIGEKLYVFNVEDIFLKEIAKQIKLGRLWRKCILFQDGIGRRHAPRESDLVSPKRQDDDAAKIFWPWLLKN